MLQNISFTKNPVTTIFGVLLIVAGLVPFVLPGRLSVDEAGQLQGLLTDLQGHVEGVIEIITGIVSLFAKDLAGKE